MTHPPRSGVTLIELLITISIVGILGAVAYPSYQTQMLRTRRAAAAGCLMEYAQYMERVYTGNLRYDQNDGAATALPTLNCATDSSPSYGFAFASGQPQQRSYTLQAAPRGVQASRDTACATLGLTQTGTKTISGSGTVADCWK